MAGLVRLSAGARLMPGGAEWDVERLRLALLAGR